MLTLKRSQKQLLKAKSENVRRLPQQFRGAPPATKLPSTGRPRKRYAET